MHTSTTSRPRKQKLKRPNSGRLLPPFYLYLKEHMEKELFTLNVDRCIADKSIPAVIRNLFVELRDKGYVHVGNFFKDLTDIDLETLKELAESTHPEATNVTDEQVENAYEHMALLGMALMVGEGCELSIDNCELGLKLAITYTTVEGLFRRNLVEVIHENWSMDGDGTLPVVKRKD